MRSLLFVPGDRRPKLDKALGSGADALILDLEDAVAPAAKDGARRIAADFLREVAARLPRPLILVRVNDLRTGCTEADLDAVMPGWPDGIMLPKAEGGRDIQHLAVKLAVREARSGLPDGATRILPIPTETARGLLAIGTIPGSSPRLMGIAWGGEDLASDLGATTDRDEAGAYTAPYRHARTMALLAAAAAGIGAVDSVYTAFRDPDGLAAECRLARRDGFAGKMAIHPAQIPIINAAFPPEPDKA